ncbi:MAG TPA: IS91 family transposase [Anaerolineae bacterium]|nr:IS91 family transposase [Anaerolineae bacterium]
MVTLGEIFRQYGPAYREKYGDRLLPSHRRAMWAIEHCRTPTLGGHVYYCEDCDTYHYHYHSCRNRHCPQCQTRQGQQWLAGQADRLLPVPYFMLTFTLPEALRAVARQHQRLIYDLLFRISAAAIQQLAADTRFVGGQLGLVGVLHTWGRNLSYHPHVHYVVPGVGWTADGQVCRAKRTHFLLPVRALSRLFRAKFRAAVRDIACWGEIPDTVWQQEWVVHCQPVGCGLPALKYLAPYIFRVALSNQRLVKLAHDKVTFRYRATDTGTLKTCTLHVEEFIRRYLQHVLPKGLVKVRYYGFFSPGLRARLARIRAQLAQYSAQSPDRQAPPAETAAAQVVSVARPGFCCPTCGRPLQRCASIPPQDRAPPTP